MNGYIHSFESMAAVDGEGLRYAVFLSGCPLRCVYCHNPDTWNGEGRAFSPEELLKKVIAYKPYFKNNGGVTFSGGEPLLQAEFIAECVELLREKNINYAIDTSGATELNDAVKYALINAQTVLLDLKFPDNDSYIKYTGKGIENVLKTLDFLEKNNVPTRIRTVVIPGINDSEEKLLKYLVHINNKECVYRYELLPFHTMGFFKYERLGLDNPLKDTMPLDMKVRDRLQKFVNSKLAKGIDI